MRTQTPNSLAHHLQTMVVAVKSEHVDVIEHVIKEAKPAAGEDLEVFKRKLLDSCKRSVDCAVEIHTDRTYRKMKVRREEDFEKYRIMLNSRTASENRRWRAEQQQWMNEDIQKLKSEHHAAMLALQSKITAVLAESMAAQAQLCGKEAEIDKCDRELAEQKVALDGKDAEIVELQTQLAEAQAQLTETEAETGIEDLREMLATKEKELEEVKVACRAEMLKLCKEHEAVAKQAAKRAGENWQKLEDAYVSATKKRKAVDTSPQ